MYYKEILLHENELDHKHIWCFKFHVKIYKLELGNSKICVLCNKHQVILGMYDMEPKIKSMYCGRKEKNIMQGK